MIRKLDKDKINQLKETGLFNNNLLYDIKNGGVFPAIRNNNLHAEIAALKVHLATQNRVWNTCDNQVNVTQS